FLRDGSGPFREHDSFWHPLVPRPDETGEIQRKMEMIGVARFRLDHIAALFDLERQAVFDLHGGQEALRLVPFHKEYTDYLIDHGVERSIYGLFSGMVQQHGWTGKLKWSLNSPDGLVF
ncbi:unnamed protein product, partial [Symbiodinium pilosum]